jgi:ubiquinone/menaquinone biosynthesis C-methylase UbiE
MSEVTATSPKPEANQPNPTIPLDWQVFAFDARIFAHSDEKYTGKVMGGWGINSFTEFARTPYEIQIPTRRNYLTDEKKAMLDEINPEVLKTESFQDFFRHVDMLIAFSDISIDPEGKTVISVYPTRPVIQASIGIIIERARSEGKEFSEKVESYYHQGEAEYLEDDINLRVMACLEEAAKDSDFRLSPQLIETIYEDGLSRSPGFINHAIFYDERNKVHGESIGLMGRFKRDASEKLLVTSGENKEIFDPRFPNNQILSEVLVYALLQADSQTQIATVLEKITPTLGVERIRKNLRDYVKDNPSFQDKFEAVFNYLGFDPKEPQVDLVRDIYEQIDFSEYSPNQEIQNREIEILKRELKGKKKILDIACGTGRHLKALSTDSSHQLSGIDIVPKHIDEIKQKIPDTDVRVGSWFDMPFEDKSFDAAYCLGRSFTHNTTLPDAVQSLREMRRIIKDDGFIIMDLPDPNVGDYKEMIERVRKLASEKNIDLDLPGLITDSPDFEHFFDRYAPDDKAFDAIAYLAGLKATKIDSIDYHGNSGKTNTNNYWRLEKFTQHIPTPVKISLLARIQGLDVPIPNMPALPIR